jgi:hypothetical protein
MHKIPREDKIRPEWEDDNYHSDERSLLDSAKDTFSKLERREKLWALAGLGGLAMLTTGIAIHFTEYIGVDSTAHLNELVNVLEGIGSGDTVLSMLGFSVAISESHRTAERENQELSGS